MNLKINDYILSQMKIYRDNAETFSSRVEAGLRVVGAIDNLNRDVLDIAEDQEAKTWAEEVAYIELDSELKIADIDYYEIDEDGDKKTEFTWDEAMKRFKDDPNWRLPTPKELNQMVLDLGYNDEGVFEGELFAKNLGHEGEDSGHYWSSTPYVYTYSRYLYFNSTNIYPQNGGDKTVDFAIRCVRRQKDEVAFSSEATQTPKKTAQKR